MYGIIKSSESHDAAHNAETVKASSPSEEVKRTLIIKYGQTTSKYKKYLRVGQRSTGCGACGHNSPD
jgi:hypothetical protein